MKLTPDEIKGLRADLAVAKLSPEDQRIAECLISAAERVAELEAALTKLLGLAETVNSHNVVRKSDAMVRVIEAALAAGEADHA